MSTIVWTAGDIYPYGWGVYAGEDVSYVICSGPAVSQGFGAGCRAGAGNYYSAGLKCRELLGKLEGFSAVKAE